MSQEGDLLAATKLEDGFLVVMDVAFGLIDRGTDLTELEETFELRRADVTHAKSSYLTFPIQSFALLPEVIKRDLVRLEFFAEAHAAERRVPA